MSFEHPDLVEFFSGNRRAPEHLYPSERRLLEPLAGISQRVLDVGCGAGGFASIWCAFNPRLHYVGVDIGKALIERARELHPDHEFHVGDAAAGLDLPDASADIVAALGWLHWEPQWRSALAELWRLTSRDLFFDIRLHRDEGELRGVQQMAYSGEWDGRTTTPYIIASWPEFAEFMLGMMPERILGYGYWGRPGSGVNIEADRVCFATFVLRRGSAERPLLWLDSPLYWPAEFVDLVDDRCSSDLEDIL
jgi:SAM-dependent methyltransferase